MAAIEESASVMLCDAAFQKLSSQLLNMLCLDRSNWNIPFILIHIV